MSHRFLASMSAVAVVVAVVRVPRGELRHGGYPCWTPRRREGCRGRHDGVKVGQRCPVEASQKAVYDLLGTPDEHKVPGRVPRAVSSQT